MGCPVLPAAAISASLMTGTCLCQLLSELRVHRHEAWPSVVLSTLLALVPRSPWTTLIKLDGGVCSSLTVALCRPGAPGGCLTIRAIKPIKEGDELCFGYIDLYQDVTARRTELEETKHFLCECEVPLFTHLRNRFSKDLF